MSAKWACVFFKSAKLVPLTRRSRKSRARSCSGYISFWQKKKNSKRKQPRILFKMFCFSSRRGVWQNTKLRASGVIVYWSTWIDTKFMHFKLLPTWYYHLLTKLDLRRTSIHKNITIEIFLWTEDLKYQRENFCPNFSCPSYFLIVFLQQTPRCFY